MTIATTISTVAYTGNGVTTAFAVPYAFFDASDLEVIERTIATGAEVVLALTTHYTVTGGAGSTGTVTAVTAPAATVTWTIRRTTAPVQNTALPSNDPFPSASVERALDRLTAIAQERARDGDRAVLVPKTETGSVLPSSVDRAGRFAGWDAAGEWIALAGAAGGAPVTPFAATLLDDVDAPAALATLGFSPFMVTMRDDVDAPAALATLGFSPFIITLRDDADAPAAQATLGLSGLAGARNVVVNGDFRVNQRNSGFVTAADNFIADRWRVAAVNGSRTAVRLLQTDFSRGAIGRRSMVYTAQYVATGGSAAGDYEALSQRIESVWTLAGSTVTRSFWARRTAGAGDVSTCFVQHFGTGGTPSADVVFSGTKHTLTTLWQRFTVTATVPSLDGKTLGTNGDDCLELLFYFSAGSTFDARTGTLGPQTITVQIADVMVEPGSVASPVFAPRPLADELAVCMREFQTSNSGGVYGTFTAGDGRAFGNKHPTAAFGANVRFPVPMRVAPTVTTFDQIGNANRFSFFAAAWTNSGNWADGPNATVGGFYVGHAQAGAVETHFTWQAATGF